MWLTGLGIVLQTKRSPGRFLVRACAWLVGQVPSRDRERGKQLMFLSHSHSLPLSKINKYFLKRNKLLLSEAASFVVTYNSNPRKLIQAPIFKEPWSGVDLDNSIFLKTPQVFENLQSSLVVFKVSRAAAIVATASTGNLIKMQIFRLYKAIQSLKFWGWGPVLCGLSSSPSNASNV